MKKSFIRRPFVYVPIVVVIILIIFVVVFRGSSTKYETTIAKRGNFKLEVSASGRVVAKDRADLGFEQNGKISAIYAKVGDSVKVGSPIASIENADLKAELAQKSANLAKEQAKLASLLQGTRPEQLVIDKQNFADSSKAMIIAMRSAYAIAEGAMLNNADTMFTNGNSVNPTLKINAQSYNEQRDMEGRRQQITERLKAWKDAMTNITDTTNTKQIDNARVAAESAFTLMKTFSDKLSYITNNIYEGNSGLSQSTIDSYKNSANVLGTNIASALETYQTASTAWNKYKAGLDLSLAGATKEDIVAEQAQVQSAMADVEAARSKLAKSIIFAPFDGIITKADGKIGEIISPNTSLFSVMSTSTFEIESYVPEVHIANIKAGDKASVILDAYGEDVIFNALVYSVDPAETIKDGVSTYKVTLVFKDNDPRIKSGMTASVKITTLEKNDTIVVPQGFIKMIDGKKTVTILNGKNKTTVPVVTDGLSALGQSEIVQGLAGGETLILEK